MALDGARVHALLVQAFASRPAAGVEAQLAALDVPCARSRQLSGLLREAAAGDLMTLPLRKTPYPRGSLTDFGAGFKADRDAGAAPGPAPRPGQHTAAVLATLGVTPAEMATLAVAGTIRC